MKITKKIFVLCAMLMGLSATLSAQTWTWTHEFTMKSSPNPVYFYNEGQEFFLKATSTYATNANEATAFKVEYKRESSTDRYYISYENDGTKYVNQNNGGQNWGDTSYGWYFDTNGSGITIRTRDILDSNKRSISANDDGIYYPKNDKSTNATWYVISATQMNNYNRYMEVYQAAQNAGVDVSSYSSANNSNAAIVITNIENAIKAKFSSATIDNPVNATGLIKNVGYEFNTWNYGWTTEDFEEHANEGKFVGSHIAEMYQHPNWNQESKSGHVEQTISNIPAGVYLLRAKAVGGDGNDNLYAKVKDNTFSTLTPRKSDDEVFKYSVLFSLDSESDVTIGFARVSSQWWSACDDFELIYLGSTSSNDNLAVDVSLTGKYLYTTTNAGDVAFGSGAHYGTQAIPTNDGGILLDINITNGIASIKYGPDKYLFDAGNYNIFTDKTNVYGTTQFIAVNEAGGYKFILAVDPNYAIGLGKDGDFNVLKLVNVNDAPVWKIADAKASLSVKGDKYGTFIAPYDVKLPAGVEAYTVDAFNTNSVNLAEINMTNNVLPACTPAIIKNTSSDPISTYCYGIDERGDKTEEVDGYLVGFYVDDVAIPADGTAYVMQTQDGKQAFYKVTTAFTGVANRCYLKSTSNGANVLRFDGDEETETSIESILNNEQTAVIYDLSGRRVNNTAKGGIYIINGKKVIK